MSEILPGQQRIAPAFHMIGVEDEDAFSPTAEEWQKYVDDVESRGLTVEAEIIDMYGTCGEDCVSPQVTIVPTFISGTEQDAICFMCKFDRWEGEEDGFGVRGRCLSKFALTSNGIVEAIKRRATT